MINNSMYVRKMHPLSGSKNQSGATLIIVLVLLILITLFGLSAVRGTLLQERMVSGTIANNAAFQAAEAGLRKAESKAASTDPGPNIPDSGCAKGYCARSPAGQIPHFAEPGFWKKTDSTGPVNGGEIKSGPFTITPKYIIEDFGKGETGAHTATDRGVAFEPPSPPPAKLYRITAYAVAPNTDAETILQSIYIR